MKQLLSRTDVLNLASALSPKTTPSADAHRILREFQKHKHLTVTRRDLTVALSSLGHDTKDHVTWWTAHHVLLAISTKSSKRGHYVLPPSEEVGDTLTRKFIMKAIEKDSIDRHIASRLKSKFSHIRWDDLLSSTHLWLFIWASKGTCDRHIQEGKPPTVAIFTAWMAQKIHQETYKKATNPLNREFGLRTQKEILARKRTGDNTFIMGGAKTDPNCPQVRWSKSDEDSPARPVFVSPEPDDEVVFTKDQIQLVRDGIVSMRTRSSNRYGLVFDCLIGKLTKEELAEKESIAVESAAILYQKVRGDMRRLPTFMRIAKRVLEVLREEPFSTFGEVCDEASLSSREARKVFKFLGLQDLVLETPGKESSFRVSERGSRVLSVGWTL